MRVAYPLRMRAGVMRALRHIMRQHTLRCRVCLSARAEPLFAVTSHERVCCAAMRCAFCLRGDDEHHTPTPRGVDDATMMLIICRRLRQHAHI